MFYAAEIWPINVKIVEGNTLELNCALTNYSSPDFNNSSMYFAFSTRQPPKRKIIDQKYYTVVGPRMLKLQYPVSLDDSGTYECWMNKTSPEFLAGVVVAVGRK